MDHATLSLLADLEPGQMCRSDELPSERVVYDFDTIWFRLYLSHESKKLFKGANYGFLVLDYFKVMD